MVGDTTSGNDKASFAERSPDTGLGKGGPPIGGVRLAQ